MNLPGQDHTIVIPLSAIRFRRLKLLYSLGSGSGRQIPQCKSGNKSVCPLFWCLAKMGCQGAELCAGGPGVDGFGGKGHAVFEIEGFAGGD